MNFFTKLISLKTESGFSLLYGFSGQTDQPCYPWNTKKLDKHIPLVCFHTIWTENQEVEFEEKIQDKLQYEVKEGVTFSFGLLHRSTAVSNDEPDAAFRARPISEFQIVSEYWNINKGNLFHAVEQTLGGEGKPLFLKTCNLLFLLQKECGINFSKDGWRFGNYEIYRKPQYYKYFSISTSKCNDLKITTIRKRFPIEEPLVIRCASEHRRRWHTDAVKRWDGHEEAISFNAGEPMSRIRVQIWSANTGELVFSIDRTLCMQIYISMNISGHSFVFTDSWTKKLFQSAPGQKLKIEQIETVSRVLNDRPIVIKSETYSEIDAALEEGNQILSQYRREKIKGAFIPKIGKSGEMDSFLKIKEYLSAARLRKVIIADPFFSVRAAEKFLSRITNQQLELVILTSLTNKNPDTDQDEDATKICKEFIGKNNALLHQNLVVKNLRRGNAQVFHDRYLIRYFEDGTIDGFLLSNSLNSAGQSYPFVIAPLEKEVCLEICEYLDDLTDSLKQNVLPANDRIVCEILYDGNMKKSKKNNELNNKTIKYVLGDLLKDCYLSGHIFSMELQTALQTAIDISTIRFRKADLPQVAAAIKSYWPSEPMKVLEAIGEAIGHMYCWSSEDFYREFQEIGDQLIEPIFTFSHLIEAKQNHMRRGIESPEYKYWAFLNGSAKVSEQGLHLLIDNPDHVFYPEIHYLPGCYLFLLHISPKQFLLLMEGTSSPLMLHVLTEYMAIGGWFPNLYSCLQTSKMIWLRALAAEWLLNCYQKEHMDNNWILSILSDVPTDKRLIQCLYILSQITFKVRVFKENDTRINDYSQLRILLMKKSADTLNECVKTGIDSYEDFNWLFECESASYCYLYLSLAQYVNDEIYRNWILDQAIKRAHNELKQWNAGANCEQLISHLIRAIFLRYGEAGEGYILENMFQKTVFSQAVEPYRNDYDYSSWKNAYTQAEWQLMLLQEYLKYLPTAINIKKQLKIWEPRFNSACLGGEDV